MFTSHNVLSKDESPAGFILLQVLRSYLELDMFASLSVQTESTLEFGKKELKIFEQAIQVSFNLKCTLSHEDLILYHRNIGRFTLQNLGIFQRCTLMCICLRTYFGKEYRGYTILSQMKRRTHRLSHFINS